MGRQSLKFERLIQEIIDFTGTETFAKEPSQSVATKKSHGFSWMRETFDLCFGCFAVDGYFLLVRCTYTIDC